MTVSIQSTLSNSNSLEDRINDRITKCFYEKFELQTFPITEIHERTKKVRRSINVIHMMTLDLKQAKRQRYDEEDRRVSG